MQQLAVLDADCAEALWALDQPAGPLDRRAMLRDTLAALEQLLETCAQVRTRLPDTTSVLVLKLEPTIRASLHPREAYNDAPGHDPQIR